MPADPITAARQAIASSPPSGEFLVKSRRAIWDAIIPAATFVSLMAACVISVRGLKFWGDEVLTWTLSTDPSFAHMMRTLASGPDVGPLYFSYMWGWARLFGGSELSLRIASGWWLAPAAVALWTGVRRFYGLTATAFGVLLVTCTSSVLLFQLVNARQYGMFFFLACAATSLYAMRASGRKVPLLAVFVVHAAWLWVQPLALMYSGVVLLALIVCDLSRRRLHVADYAPILAAWMTLLLWWGPLRRAAANMDPHTWVLAPRWADLRDSYSFGIAALPMALFAVVLLLSLSKRSRQPDSVGNPLLVLGAGLLLVPLAVFVESRLWIPSFVLRYLCPAAIGAAILLAHLVAVSTGDESDLAGWRGRAQVAGWAVLVMVLLAYPIITVMWSPASGVPNAQIESIVPPGVPIVVEDEQQFLPLLHYATNPARYFFVLDREIAYQSDSGNAAAYYNVMKRWAESGYARGQIVDSDDFLRSHPTFAVLHTDGLHWQERRLKNYILHPLGAVEDMHVSLAAPGANRASGAGTAP